MCYRHLLMGLMDPSDWLQGTIGDEGGLDSSSPSSADMLACSRPLMERRLRPPQDLSLKCPRCESTNTKFCYYNNYSLTQPRYFCKTCRRYWTKGGTLRNIPVGGGCRKNRKQSSSSNSSKKASADHHQSSATSSAQAQVFNGNPTELQLSFPEVQLSHHLTSLIGANGTSFLDSKYNALLDRQSYDGFLGSKFDALVGNGTSSTGATRAHDLLGSSGIGVDFSVVGDHHHHMSTPSSFINPLSSSSSPFGVSAIEGNNSGVLESSYQRLMLPYDNYHHGSSNGDEMHQGGLNIDMKPNPKLLALQWQDHNNGGGVANKETFGHNGGFNGLNSWGRGMFNAYTPSSATNPLI